ncbi:hypothetical protein B0H11DRAFT_2332048 [Mycena galericulata]|nr:hypothetical protein B0H11DRAFT_2332048 [Mycena galericulata]
MLELTIHDRTLRAFHRRDYSQISLVGTMPPLLRTRAYLKPTTINTSRSYAASLTTAGNIPPCPDEPSHAETIVDWYPTGTMHLQIYWSLLSSWHGVHQYPRPRFAVVQSSVSFPNGHKIDSWRTVQTILRQDDFISGILKFDTTTQMTKQLRDTMKRDFLSCPSYNFETVQRASKACGPLVKWALAQVRFSEILDKVEPLRNEVQSLEVEAETTKKQAQAIIQMIAELEAKIAKYKQEYVLLISETQAIKSEMERVQSRTFDTEMSIIVGDVLLSAAFLAYRGFFDQHYREVMWQEWSNHLSEANIKYKPELSLTEYLSTADDRLSWQSKSLPSDNLTTENAIMLKRFNRYLLIINPMGQATTFLLNEYKECLGKCSPVWESTVDTMFLSTRDPSVEFSPDICSFSIMYISKSRAHY